MVNTSDIKARLKREIKNNPKLNQKVLADSVGISGSYLSEILSDKSPGTFDQVMKIAEKISEFKTIAHGDGPIEIGVPGVSYVDPNLKNAEMSVDQIKSAYVQMVDLNERYRKEILRLRKKLKSIDGGK